MTEAASRLSAALASHYRLDREIGEGGMATVYLAHDLRHDRKVAVKVLRPELAAVIGADRFLAEIKTTANLQHPHILPLFDSGAADSFLFYVMPFIEGESLRDRLTRERQLPVPDAVRIANEVASALDYAHRHGVIHRDIKPENILLHDGRAVVADFGIALAASTAGSRMTETGMSLGTPKYMSPEQALGERTIDARSDVYALGCVLYEMLVGEPPFNGPTAQAIISRVINAEPPSLTAQRKTIPPHIETAVLTALAKLPADRYPSAAAFGAAISARASVDGRRAAPVAVAAPPRRRTTLGILGMIVAGAALVAVGIAADRLRGGFAAPPATFAQKTFGRQAIFNARFAPDGKTIVFSAGTDGAAPDLFIIRPSYPEPQPLGFHDAQLLSISSSGEMAVLLRAQYIGHRLFTGTLARVPLEGGAPRELLEGVREADWSPDGSQLAIIHMVNGKDRLEFPVGTLLYEAAAGYLSDPRVSPDGKSVAFVEHPIRFDDRGAVDVVDRAGKRTVVAAGFSTVQGVAWSPAGDEIVFSAGNVGFQRVVQEVSPTGRNPHVTLTSAGGAVAQDIARTGHLLMTRDEEPLRLMVRWPGAAADADESWLDDSDTPVLSHDGTLLAFSDQGADGGADYAVMLRKSGAAAARLGDGVPDGFSPDAAWVLASVPSTPPRLVLYPTSAGAERRIDTGQLGSISGAGWFPDGHSVLVCGNEPSHAAQCYETSLDGGALRPMTPEGTAAGLVSPDGQNILAQNHRTGDYRVYQSATDSGRVVPGLTPTDNVIRWSTDGRALYVLRGFLVDRLDLATGRLDPVLDLSPKAGSGTVALSGAAIADDPRVYAYDAWQYLSQLFVVDGMR